jgi:hypothetical protein
MAADLYPAFKTTARPSLLKRIAAAILIPERALTNQTEEIIPGVYLADAERFLDGFLLNYFYELIRVPPFPPIDPWRGLCGLNPWLKRMPELWERVSGKALTGSQLNYVAGILYERLSVERKKVQE